jgi:DNA-binding response OmpR family regulator
MRILVVEDEKQIADDLARALAASGYLAEFAHDGETAWFMGETEDFAAIVLDLGLPQLDGLTVLKRWRQAGIRTPVLVLTARGSWRERVEGMDAGADDYLPKPFEMDELLARLRALLRRSTGQASARLEAHGVEVDTRQMKVSVGGVPVALSPLEYRLLHYLLHHRGRVVTQLELTEQLYAQDFERESNAVEVLIGRVRRKLKADIIETRRGFGYTIKGDAP